MLSGSLRSRVATLTVAEIVGCSFSTECNRMKSLRTLLSSSSDVVVLPFMVDPSLIVAAVSS